MPDSARVQNPDDPMKYDVLTAHSYPLEAETGEKKAFANSWNWAPMLPILIDMSESIKTGTFSLPGEHRGFGSITTW